MEHEVDLLVDEERLRHVLLQEHEIRVAEMLDVGQRPGVEIVDTDHPVTLRQQRIAQMRPQKAAATGHKAGGHTQGRIAGGYPRAALRTFLETSTCKTYFPFGSFSASPSLASRLQTTAHFLQRGRLLQHRFFGLTIRLANRGSV